MTKGSRWGVWGLGLILVGTGILGLTGCESMRHALGMGEETPLPAARYYDFPDVLVPTQLSVDPKGSVVYEAGGVKYGILLFSGRVEVESLVEFFRSSMTKDGWTFVSSVKFSRILLNFAKPDRTCQVLIWDKTLTTEVEVMVHPLKPTG
ncbi:MAG: hypothetical protein ACUVXD_09400 [Thermodesulfobacteriota bacterium]